MMLPFSPLPTISASTIRSTSAGLHEYFARAENTPRKQPVDDRGGSISQALLADVFAASGPADAFSIQAAALIKVTTGATVAPR